MANALLSPPIPTAPLLPGVPALRERKLARHFAPAALVLVTVVFFTGVQITGMHREATNATFNSASAVGETLSYDEMLAAWNGDGPNTELSGGAAVWEMVWTDSPILHAGNAFVVTYPVETFARTSCVYSVITPSGAGLEKASGECSISGNLPPMIAQAVGEANQ